ncbi:MAG: three-Cys-motif partner protein TcmP [Gemmatimonadales bacterium]
MSRDEEECLASDGLIARKGGAHAELKLAWLETFLAHALAATKSMRDRAYIDLFAGPGITIPKNGGLEIPAGALRALQAVAHGKNGVATFTEAHLLNLDPGHSEALRARVDSLPDRKISRDMIYHHVGDANLLVRDVLSRVRDGYVLAFVDPESASQLPWSTIEALRSQGHNHIDAYILYPWGQSIRRRAVDQPGILDEFYGTEEWREIDREFPTDAQRHDRSRAHRELYLRRLGGLWKHAIPVREVTREQTQQNLYHMLYATDHPDARKIAAGVVKAFEKRHAQPRLL